MKLNLGCGKRRWPGFVNVDLKDSDRDCDIRKLPFADESADEIHAIHVCEHFLITEILSILKEWRRVLKTGGKLIVELPCWDKVRIHISKDEADNMTRWALYGAPKTHKDGIPAVHKWCWSLDEFRHLLITAGFEAVKSEPPKYHVPNRDMRLVATK